MPSSPLRYKRLMRELPKHKTAYKALIASGFTKNTALKQSKSVLRSAIRHEAKEILLRTGTSTKSKQLMNEILGITSQDLFERLKWIALENDKDVASALKVLLPLAKEHGVVLASDEPANVVVPVLNLGFGTGQVPENMAKNIETGQDMNIIDVNREKDGLIEP